MLQENQELKEASTFDTGDCDRHHEHLNLATPAFLSSIYFSLVAWNLLRWPKWSWLEYETDKVVDESQKCTVEYTFDHGEYNLEEENKKDSSFTVYET